MAQPEVRDLRPAAFRRTTGWVLRRAVFGLLLLFGFAFGGALLLNASIDPAAPVLSDNAEE